MKTVTQVIAKIIKVVCPYCGEELTDWLKIPRGLTDKCDICNNEFKIAEQATVLIDN